MTSPTARGGDTPLVLLHGATSSARAWQPILPILQEQHRVFVPSLAGHRGGPQLSVPPERTVLGIVDATCGQLDEAGIDSAHIVGNSLGGWVALELARRGRARSVVALSPAGAWRLPRDLTRMLILFRMAGRLDRWAAVRRWLERPAVRRVVLRLVAEHTDRLTPADLAGMFEDLAGCTILAALLGGAREAGALQPFDELECPVLIAWAERDRMLPFPRYGLPMLAAVPGAQFQMLPGVGHVPMIDEPQLVARSILGFVSRVERHRPTDRGPVAAGSHT